MPRRLLLSALLLLAAPSARAEEPAIDFGQQIAPILNGCLRCHGPDKQQGGLRFDAGPDGAKAADSGEPAVVPGKAAESALVRRVTSTDDAERMPPEGDPLTAEQIALLRRWIDAGAAWPAPAKAPETRRELEVTEADRAHWAYRPLSAPSVPPPRAGAGAVASPIDCFLDAALAAKGLEPGPPAPPAKLARRIYFDLTGLPPGPAELAAYETAAARDPNAAVAELVDRLLASRHYGERWARHWLDVARYADSNGQEQDQDRPFAYPYRDFVIRALNDDLPFDTFVRWQIAGDELAPDDPAAVAATGFLVAGPHTVLDVPMEEEKIRNRFNELDDLLATLGSGMLGLTVGCARCHDHKYDPIPTRDYYRLLAAFQSGDRGDTLLGPREEIARYKAARGAWEQQVKERQTSLADWLTAERGPLDAKLRSAKIDALPLSPDEKALLRNPPDTEAGKKLMEAHRAALAVSDDELRKAVSEAQRAKWDELQGAVKATSQAEPQSPAQAWSFHDTTAAAQPAWLLHRGDFADKSEPVSLGFLSIVAAKPAESYLEEARAERQRDDSTYQRAAVARWIADVEQGAGALLARVIVNRVWQHHFGEGLVRTPSDFGTQGERPTHPELLEWLAHDFVSHGWRLKRLHRQIMRSAAYRRSSQFDAATAKADPDNRLLARRRPQRLEAEALRDALLVAAGTLNLEPYGPAFKPPIAEEAMVARNLKKPYEPSPVEQTRRRSVYMFHKRVIPYPLLQAFDRPDALQSCGRRDATIVAPQALAILNDSFVRERAGEFAARVEREAGGDPAAQVRQTFLIALARQPSENELQAAVRFLRERRSARSVGLSAGAAALADFCQVVFGLNEFLYVD